MGRERGSHALLHYMYVCALFSPAHMVARITCLYDTLYHSLHAHLQEAAELTNEAGEAFDVLEVALRAHPMFQVGGGEGGMSG